ncbi:thioredoxin domain-containing protein [Sphingopyxis sp. BSNA05]|uniref:thioredoxin domain-containing protein n=1 Tax=Sphingopyxis sp. BSNA05 TaxID=1236614 RepID=UPI00349FB6E3
MRTFNYIAPMALALALAACGEASEGEAGANTSGSIEAVEAPAGQKWSETVSKTEAGGIVMGNPDAPLKLVEYMSITCSHCKDFGEQAFAPLRDTYVESGRVSFEIRNLSAIHWICRRPSCLAAVARPRFPADRTGPEQSDRHVRKSAGDGRRHL